MALKHADIWRAIDNLAAKNNLSPSGLARKAGLSSTAFNPSKRVYKNRKRWPSTESIAQILQVTNASLDDFLALAAPATAIRTALPLATMAEAARSDMFNESGHPAGAAWDELRFPVLADPHAYALEAGKGMEPVYREGDVIVLSPAEKPRRGDRVLLRLRDGGREGGFETGQLGRESAQKIELLSATPGAAARAVPRSGIAWMHRIVWARY